MSNYTVRIDGEFIATVKAESALEAAKLLADGQDYVEVTQTSTGAVEEFNLG